LAPNVVTYGGIAEIGKRLEIGFEHFFEKNFADQSVA